MLIKRFALFILALFPCLCLATTIHINPVRLELKPGEKNGTFKVNNAGDNTALFQIKIVKWTQENGQDIYTETKDIIANPPMMKIPAKDFQLVRVGLRTPLKRDIEQNYRLIATEIADTSVPNDSLQIRTLIRFSIPIFIIPKEKRGDLDIETVQAKNGDLEFHIFNNSNRHIQVNNIDFYLPEQTEPLETSVTQDKFAYLLPEQARSWPLKWKVSEANKDVVVKLKTDWGPIEKVVKVSTK
jgi:fimbrial chaperone protein